MQAPSIQLMQLVTLGRQAESQGAPEALSDSNGDFQIGAEAPDVLLNLDVARSVATEPINFEPVFLFQHKAAVRTACFSKYICCS